MQIIIIIISTFILYHVELMINRLLMVQILPLDGVVKTWQMHYLKYSPTRPEPLRAHDDYMNAS